MATTRRQAFARYHRAVEWVPSESFRNTLREALEIRLRLIDERSAGSAKKGGAA
jgi:hypothetical protein